MSLLQFHRHLRQFYGVVMYKEQRKECYISLILGFTEGPGAGLSLYGPSGVHYGSGASHGGEAGAENSSNTAPSAYGNFIKPDRFGSAGGDGTGHTGMLIFKRFC